MPSTSNLPSYFEEPYTVKQLAPEIRLIAKDGFSFEETAEFFVNRVQELIDTPQFKDIPKEIYIKNKVWCLVRLHVGKNYPSDLEGTQDITTAMVEPLVRYKKFFNKNIVDALFGMAKFQKDEDLINEALKKMNAMTDVINRYREHIEDNPKKKQYTIDQLAVSAKVYLDVAQNLNTNDDGRILDYMGYNERLIPFMNLKLGIMPIGYDDVNVVSAKLNELVEIIRNG
jgi:hypothetical protein